MAAFFRARFARVASKYGGGISEWLAEPNAQSTGSMIARGEAREEESGGGSDHRDETCDLGAALNFSMEFISIKCLKHASLQSFTSPTSTSPRAQYNKSCKVGQS